MTIIKHKESVEVKTFKENDRNAEHFNPLKPPRKDVHIIYKKEGT